MATVVKNFRIKSGLIVEGTTGTINGQNILTEGGSDSYILNLIGGETLVKSVDSNLSVDGSGKLSINRGVVDTWYDAAGSADTAYDNAVSTAASDATTKANAAQSNAISTASTDATNKANAALASAQTYADNAASSAQSAAESYADTAANSAYNNAVTAAANDATSKMQQAESYADQSALDAENNAKSYADSLATNYDAAGAAAAAQSAAAAYTDQEISALVNSAPAMLDTLGELATALQNNPDIITNLQDVAAGKQDNLTAGDGIDLSSNTVSVKLQGGSGLHIAAGGKLDVDRSVIDGWYDAAGAASSAQSAAETFATNAANAAQTAAQTYADGLASNYDAAGAASAAQSAAETYTDNAISSGNVSATPTYAALNLGYYTKQVGNWVAASTAGAQVTAYTYGTNWGSAEFLVRVMSNTSGHQHSQLSKILVTTDAAGNVAITEYGIVTTNGNMGDVTADISGGNVRILVTPQYASSEVIVSGTLLAYND